MALQGGRADFWAAGDWNAVCYECGRKRKASSLQRNWQGYYVCKEHWEPRQPQDFVRAVADVITPPWAQPPSDVFTVTCSLENSSAIAGVAVADCARAGWVWDDYEYPASEPALFAWDSGESLWDGGEALWALD